MQERERMRERENMLSNTQDPSSLDFCFSCTRINSFQNIPPGRGRGSNSEGPGCTPTFWRLSNPGSPGGLRNCLLPGALPGHTRCSFHDKLAGLGSNADLFFNHVISTVPHLPNSHNLSCVWGFVWVWIFFFSPFYSTALTQACVLVVT